MFVGYVMCMFTGAQHVVDVNRSVNYNQQAATYSYESGVEISVKELTFTDFFSQTAELDDSENTLCASVTIIDISFHDQYFSVFKGNKYERFSRPPPSYC